MRFAQGNKTGAIISALLLAQPLFTFPVFLSVLLGWPSLWLAWSIALLPLLLRVFVTGRLTQRTPFDIPILISIAAMLLGFYLSPDQQLGSSVLQTYLACVLLYYGIVNNDHAPPACWLSLIGFLSLILLFLSVWVFQGGVGKQVVFNSWIYSLSSSLPLPMSVKPHFNAIGGACAVVIPALLSVAIFRQIGWIRWSAGILTVILGGALILSASGGGWIATAASILVVLLFRSRKVFWGGLLVSGATAAATYPVWSNWSWVSVVFPIKHLLGRFELWQATLAALKESPLAGLGLAGWWLKFPTKVVEGGPHNAYLQLYSDTGALGLLALIIAGIISIRLIWQIVHSNKNSLSYGIALGIIAGIVSGGIHALVDVNTNVMIPIGKEHLYFAVPLLWLWAALLVVCHRRLLTHDRSANFWQPGGHALPGFFLRFLPCLDRIICKCLMVKPLRRDKTSILSIELRRHKGLLIHLDDDTTVAPGDLLIELHMNNTWFVETRRNLEDSPKEMRWLVSLAFVDDLRHLAKDLADGRLPSKVKALHGVTMLSPPAQRLGFTVMELPKSIRKRLILFYLTGLRHVYYFGRNPVSLRNRPDLKEVWMSRSRLLERYLH
jgi:O-antigen ligase